MKTASKYFTQSEQDDIRKAVQVAETKTCAEIVPVVATASGRFDRAEDMVGLLLALTAMSTCWLLFQSPVKGEWGEVDYTLSLPILLCIMIGGWIAGTTIASNIGWLKRLATPKSEQLSEVLESAAKVFFDNRIHHKNNSAGVMIYVSLLEHMVVIRADEKAMAALTEEYLHEVTDDLLNTIRKQDITVALKEAISALATKLSDHLPADDEPANELPDALVLID